MLLIYFIMALCGVKQDLPAFNQLADKAGMTFTQPAGWEEVPVVKNTQMNYDYAIKPTGKSFEIRYRIQPLDEVVKAYKDWQKSKPAGSMMTDPNNLYPTVMLATAANISGGKIPPGIKSYTQEAVKHDFGADKGGALMLKPTNEFGEGYKYCLMTTIYKTDTSIAYMFFMGNNEQDFKSYIPVALTALKYK